MKQLVWMVFGLMLFNAAEAGPIFKSKKKKKQKVTAMADTTARSKPVQRGNIKPYSAVIKSGMTSSHGFVTVHYSKTDDKYFLEIPMKVMGRDIMFVNRVARAYADMRNGMLGYNGDQIGQAVYEFELGHKDNIYLKRMSFSEYATDSTSAMYQNVVSNNMQAIAEAFPIQAYNNDTTAVVIDITKFIGDDNPIVYFTNKVAKDKAGVGMQQADKSYVKSVNAYDHSVEVKALKTYTAGQNPTGPCYTMELNSSWLLLPEKPMRPRLFDTRVGYFTVSHKDFDADPQGVKTTTYANRWRLEPKPEDEEKYKRGELVEPQKPIIFYIDPTTPKKWIPYLIQGVDDWNVAFEAAGFKNAIKAMEAPTAVQDSAWDIESAHCNAIMYRPSTIPNAMGPSIADPRSGEILESHVFWYHNVMSLVKQWYLTQCGAVDPRAHMVELPDTLMGQLIRFVSSHEIGHTLGLRHNMGSSSTVPVEKLRDKAWVEAHGHTPSIMDYARFNYVAQPEDHVGEKGLFPRVNDYDQWAIYWGYRWRPEFKTAKEEAKYLGKLVTDTLRVNHRLWFGGEGNPFDPRSQAESLGDDAIKASEYGIKNLKRILPNLNKWMVEDGENFDNLKSAMSAVYNQFGTYIGHVMTNIGGVYANDLRGGDKGAISVPVERDKQKASLQFIIRECLNTPTWLYNKDAFDKMGFSFGIEMSRLHEQLFNGLIARNRLSNMLDAEVRSKNPYTITEFFTDLDNGVFSELYRGQNVCFVRRNMQRMYVMRLIDQAFSPINPNEGTFYGYVHSKSDMHAVFVGEVRKLRNLFASTLKRGGLNAVTRAHLEDLRDRMTSELNAVTMKK